MDEQKSRIQYLDIAKGLAILFMFTQHCMIIHETTAGEGSSILASIFVLLGTAPAAPVFMLIMGVFLATSKATTKQNVIRGTKLIILGYILNLLRFTIPLLIAGTESFVYLTGETPLDMLFAIDIFQLAGLSIIAGTLIKKTTNNKIIIPILILIILLASPFLWGKLVNIPLLSMLWGTGKNIYFPFFSWFAYTLFGMYLSKYLLNTDHLKENKLKFIWTGLAIMLIGFLTIDTFPTGDYYRSGIAIHLLIIGFIFLWLPICFWISQKVGTKNTASNTLIFWSENVSAMYFIQWFFFGWSILIFDANKQNVYIAALIGLAILSMTHLLVKTNISKKVFSRI